MSINICDCFKYVYWERIMKIMEIIKPIEEAISLTAYNHGLYNKLSDLAEHRIKADVSMKIYKSGSTAENTVPTLAIEFHSDNAPGWLGVSFKQGMNVVRYLASLYGTVTTIGRIW